MASAVTSLPIRVALDMEESHPLITLSVDETNIEDQPQSMLLCMSQDILLRLVQMASRRIGNGLTLASLICIVNCSNTCKLLRVACRYARTFADSYDFVQTIQCRDDVNLNRQRSEIRMTGGCKFALQKVPSNDTNAEEAHESGAALVILRDCNKDTTSRNTDNPFGKIYLLLVAPMDKTEPIGAWSAVALSLKNGLEFFSGVCSLHDGILRRGTGWDVLGPEKTEAQQFTHAEEYGEFVHDETVVGVKQSICNPAGDSQTLPGLHIITSYSSSEALSSIRAWLPGGAVALTLNPKGDEERVQLSPTRIPLFTFFNKDLPADLAVCNIKGVGEDRINMMSINIQEPAKALVEGTLDIDPRNIVTGRRGAAYAANAALQAHMNQDRFTGPDGRIQRGHRSFKIYAKEAMEEQWRDDQLATPAPKVRRIGACNADSDTDDMDDDDDALPSLTYNGQA
jgi:hypothetical protein